MKFGKRLKQQIQETLPGWRDKYLSYKDLKRVVRLISSAPTTLNNGSSSSSFEYVKAEEEFVVLLNNEIDKFNAFFMEQEEDFIIRHKELQQRIQKVIDESRSTGAGEPLILELDHNEKMRGIRKDIVDFHGEMVLLINYSNVNYTGLAKILKKYDKRTGGLLRLLFIQKVLQQPFFTTDLISKLIKECETAIDLLFPVVQLQNGIPAGSTTAVTIAGEGIFRNTVAAFMTMQEIRRGSSTFGHFSLPPLNLQASDHVVQFLQLNSPIPIP